MTMPSSRQIDICFSFDTTGSMAPCVEKVKTCVQEMIKRLQKDISGIRMALVAHGDYCDAGTTYVTKHIDFTTDVSRLCQWVQSVGSTGGGDADECYELVLYEVQSLNWRTSTRKALVMIGDANPHEPSYPQNVKNLDWRIETEKLGDMGVRIYAVQCLGNTTSDDFYETIADRTTGRYVRLDQLTNVVDFILAICYREKGVEFLKKFESEVRARGGLNQDLERLFGALGRGR